MSNVFVAAVGTRGDVQPYIALARTLSARGHQVAFACDSHYLALVPGGCGELVELGVLRAGDLRPLLSAAFAARDPLLRAQFYSDAVSTRVRSRAPWLPRRACEADFAVLNLPLAHAFAPHLKTIGRVGRLAVGLNLLFRDSFIDAFVDLAPEALLLNALSELVTPSPKASFAHKYLATGFWFLDQEQPEVSPVVERFLADGTRPVLVTMGSMMHALATAGLIARFTGALEAAGARGILQLPGSFSPRSEGPVLIVGDEPCHEWLLSRVGGVVHHGGLGVTGATLRAGLPAVTVPLFADQPTWAARLVEAGLSPGYHVLDDESSLAALPGQMRQLLDDSDMLARARGVADLMAKEDGVGRACEALEAFGGTKSDRPLSRRSRRECAGLQVASEKCDVAAGPQS